MDLNVAIWVWLTLSKMSGLYPDYVKLDFEKGEIPFVLRKYDPPKNRHCKNMTQEQVKEEVMSSPKLKGMITEVGFKLNNDSTKNSRLVFNYSYFYNFSISKW